jgi:hypothetical protein
LRGVSTYALERDAKGDGDAIVVVTLSGSASYEKIAELLEELETLAAGEREPLRILIDESGLRPSLVSPSDIRRIVVRWQGARDLRRARIAVLAPGAVIYGLNRMVHGFGGSEAEKRIGVFKQRVDADTWLRTAPA